MAFSRSQISSKKHSAFTGGGAKISRKVGGKFFVWDGWCDGKNLELQPDRKIVQSWRAEMDGWPENHYSKITFSFSKTKSGTKLTFIQTSLPSECAAEISQGWKEHYWRPMKEMLEK